MRVVQAEVTAPHLELVVGSFELIWGRGKSYLINQLSVQQLIGAFVSCLFVEKREARPPSSIIEMEMEIKDRDNIGFAFLLASIILKCMPNR